MLQKLLCWILGHKVVVKAYNGDTIKSSNGFGDPITYSMYKFEQLRFCIRCGKQNQHYKELP